MSKQEFLDQLRKGLSGLPQEDIEERLTFYSEMIDDQMEEGIMEEDAVSRIGSVDTIISQIKADIPLAKLVREKITPKKHLKAWEIVLLVLGSPIWLSLLIAALAIILAAYMVLWSVVITLIPPHQQAAAAAKPDGLERALADALTIIIQHISYDIRVNGIRIGYALHPANYGFPILTAQAFLCCGRIPDLPILRIFGYCFSSVVGLANKNAIPVLVHSIVQRDLIGERVNRWPLTVLDRVRVNFCLFKCFPKLNESRWLFQLLLRCLDIFFFNDKIGPVFVALGKENRNRRIGIDAASCEQKHFLSGLGDCGIGCNCNDLIR